jgi:DNA polymerase alpha subunit A
MLEVFIQRLSNIDPDMIVAHNLCGGMFDIILARIGYLKIKHWSKVGRFRRSQIPNKKVDTMGSSYGGSQWVPR